MKDGLAAIRAALVAMFSEPKPGRYRMLAMGTQNTLPIFKTRPGWRNEQRKLRFKKLEKRQRRNRKAIA